MTEQNMSLADEIKAIMGEAPNLEDLKAAGSPEDLIGQHKEIMNNAVITIQEGKITVILSEEMKFRVVPRKHRVEATADGKEWKEIECPALQLMNSELYEQMRKLESFISGMALHAFKEHM